MQRKDIHLISRHSNVTENSVEEALQEHVYNNKEAWLHFLKIFLITLGIGFSVSGIIFFFAYNWADLHKFIKIGLIEGLIVASTLVSLHPKFNQLTRNIILSGVSVLVGVLFAVYGQIYQTGANAYDFFLGWTVFITIWTLIARFSPLWLIFLVLVNTTIILYSEQVANDWSQISIFSILFLVNLVALFGFLYFRKTESDSWFEYTLGLAVTFYATVGLIIGIFHDTSPQFTILLILVIATYSIGIWYGMKTKNGFYISVIPFSIIIVIAAYLINLSSSEGMFLLICLFIIASITLTIKNLLDTQKRWNNEK